MNIIIKSNAEEISEAMTTLFGEQIPFAVSFAINRTAFGIRDAQRKGMADRFTIRRQWVLSGIQVQKKSDKRDLTAIIGIPESRQFLFRFEEGGVFTPHRASRYALPAEVRRTATGVVPKSQRPRAFRFEAAGSGAIAEVFRGEHRTFAIRRRDGSGGIFQRYGHGPQRGRRRTGEVGTRVRTLFTFSPKARIPTLLQFEPTAKFIFETTYADNFEQAWDLALRTAR